MNNAVFGNVKAGRNAGNSIDHIELKQKLVPVNRARSSNRYRRPEQPGIYAYA